MAGIAIPEGADGGAVACGRGEGERRAGGPSDAGDCAGCGGRGQEDSGRGLRDGPADTAGPGASVAMRTG